MAEEGSGRIRDFINNSYLRTGFLKPSDFLIDFYNTAGNSIERTFGFVDDFFTKLSANIVSIEIPGFTIEVDESPYRHKVQKRTLSDITTVFYDSKDHEIRKNFHRWINGIAQDDSDIADINRRYLDECMINMSVKQILPSGEFTNSSKWEYFQGIFPTSVQSINFDVTNENEIGTTTVLWKYRHHTIGNSSNEPGWDGGVSESSTSVLRGL